MKSKFEREDYCVVVVTDKTIEFALACLELDFVKKIEFKMRIAWQSPLSPRYERSGIAIDPIKKFQKDRLVSRPGLIE